jgi:hypothetical protein
MNNIQSTPLEGGWAGGPAFELPKLSQLWVPRPSRTLRRAGTGLPKVNGFWFEGLKQAGRTYAIGSFVPALAQNARTGHPQF